MNSQSPGFPIALTVPEPRSVTLSGAQAAETFASSLVVADDESYQFADQQLAEMKGHMKTLETERRTIVDPINASVARINDLFRPARTFYEQAEALIKGKMLTYRQAQERKRQEAEAEARRQAQAEQRQREEDALRRSSEAAAAGDAEASQVALEDAVAPVLLPVVQAPPPPTGAHSSVSKRWEAEGTNLAETIAAAAAGNKNAIACLCYDTTEMGKRVRALGAEFVVPGVTVREREVLASRARR